MKLSRKSTGQRDFRTSKQRLLEKLKELHFLAGRLISGCWWVEIWYEGGR